MRPYLPLVLLFAAFLAIAPRAFAADAPQSFYQDSERGWVWYEPAAPEPSPVEPRLQPPSPQAPTEPALEPLSSKWFREKLNDYRDAAIDNPTDDNVALYLYLQRVAMEKADAFKNTGERVVLNYPGLDENQRTPQSAVAKAAARKVSRTLTKDVMGRLAANAGLWYFFRSDCPYCHAQGPILEMLQNLYGFSILPISLDGLPTPDGLYPDFRVDQGQGEQLGVRATPTLFLVTVEGQVLRISEGLHTLADLEDRVFTLGHEAGLVTDDEFNTITWRAKSTLVDVLPENLPADIANDPAAFTALLRAAALDGRSTPAIASPARTSQ